MSGLVRLYQLLRIEPREIRLLRLHPDRDEFAPVKCTLFKASLREPEGYRALSYVWGDTKSKQPVQVNGLEFEPTENLYGALRHLRPVEKDLVIWIDAMCIDQYNVQERNSQVQMMRDIYENATVVTVWLGEPGDHGHIGIGMMKAWAEEYEKFKDKYLEEFFEGNKAIPPQLWDATRDIMSRPYWTRVWVYQEFVLARHVDIRCGYKGAQFVDFVRANLFLGRLKVYLDTPESISKHLDTMPLQSVEPFIGHHSLRQRKRIDPSEAHGIEKFDLRLLALRTGALHSTDPRDKVYALLGVDEAREITIDVDYAKSTREVYTDLIRSTLAQKACLALVGSSGIGLPQTTPNIDLPSWVPDLRPNSARQSFSFFQRQGTFNELTMFKASAELAAKAEIDDSFRILRADVIIAGIVSKTSRPDIRDVDGWRELAMGDRNDIKHPTGIPMWQALFRTTIGDYSGYGFGRTEIEDSREALEFYELAAGFMFMGWMESPQWETDLADVYRRQGLFEVPENDRLDDFVVAFAAWRKELPTASTTLTESLQAFTGPADSENKLWWPNRGPKGMGSEFWKKLFKRQTAVCRQKKFFVTADNYIGLGPPEMQIGDRICVILGCHVPLVVRPIGTRYLVVGACYVYGMMKGEVVKSMQDGTLKTARFEFL